MRIGKALTIVACVLASFLGGALAPVLVGSVAGAQATPGVSQEIFAHSFKLVDPQGRSVAGLTCSDTGEANLTIFGMGADGQKRMISLGFLKGNPSFLFSGAKHAGFMAEVKDSGESIIGIGGADRKGWVELKVNNESCPMIRLIDQDNKPRVALMGDQGKAVITIMDRNGSLVWGSAK